MKKLLTILCLVLLFSLSSEVSFSQSNQEDCDLLCQMGLSNQTETQIKKTQTQTETLKKEDLPEYQYEVPSHRLIENGGVTFEQGSNNPFTGVSIEYENGQPEEKTYYKNGREVSTTKFYYYENGELQYRENYKNDELNGLYEIYWNNGQLFGRGHTKDGETDGLWEYFDKEGNLTKTEEWKDGEPDGLWEYFDKDGNLTKTEQYKDGKRIK